MWTDRENYWTTYPQKQSTSPVLQYLPMLSWQDRGDWIINNDYNINPAIYGRTRTTLEIGAEHLTCSLICCSHGRGSLCCRDGTGSGSSCKQVHFFYTARGISKGVHSPNRVTQEVLGTPLNILDPEGTNLTSI